MRCPQDPGRRMQNHGSFYKKILLCYFEIQSVFRDHLCPSAKNLVRGQRGVTDFSLWDCWVQGRQNLATEPRGSLYFLCFQASSWRLGWHSVLWVLEGPCRHEQVNSGPRQYADYWLNLASFPSQCKQNSVLSCPHLLTTSIWPHQDLENQR